MGKTVSVRSVFFSKKWKDSVASIADLLTPRESYGIGGWDCVLNDNPAMQGYSPDNNTHLEVMTEGPIHHTREVIDTL